MVQRNETKKSIIELLFKGITHLKRVPIPYNLSSRKKFTKNPSHICVVAKHSSFQVCLDLHTGQVSGKPSVN